MAPPIGPPGTHVRPGAGMPASPPAQSGGPVVVFTFDDGPSKALTPQLLSLLGKYGIKAAFFVLGERLQNGGTDIMKAAFKQGHQIGNHSFDHPNLALLPESKIKDQLERTQKLIGSCASPKKYFRPPYGSSNAHVRKIAAQGGYTTILWDVDTEDWRHHDTTWIDIGLKQIRAAGQSIVLNHDIHKTTVDNFEKFITEIRGRFANVRFGQLP